MKISPKLIAFLQSSLQAKNLFKKSAKFRQLFDSSSVYEIKIHSELQINNTLVRRNGCSQREKEKQDQEDDREVPRWKEKKTTERREEKRGKKREKGEMKGERKRKIERGREGGGGGEESGGQRDRQRGRERGVGENDEKRRIRQMLPTKETPLVQVEGSREEE